LSDTESDIAPPTDPRAIPAPRDAAAELFELGRFDEAEAAYREIVAKHPRLSHGWRGLGLLARQDGDHIQALEYFRVAAPLAPDDLWAQYDLAAELREQGDFGEAEAVLKSFAERHPNSAQALIVYADFIRDKAEPGQRIALLQRAVALEPDHFPAKLALADEYLTGARLDEAEAIYNAALAEQAFRTAGHMGMARVARRRGDRVEALEHFRAAAKLDPEDVWKHDDVATELRELGRLDEAEAAYREVMAKNARFSHGWHALGTLARRRGDHARALAYFRTAAEVDPDHVWAHYDIAAELRRLRRFDEAEGVLKAFVEKHPDSAQGLILYADGVRYRADVGEIIEIYKKALAKEPDNVSAKIALANEYLSCWRLIEAEDLYDSALALERRHFAALMGKGQIARRRGLRDAALQFFEAAVAEPAADEWAAIELSTELLNAGRFEQSRQTILTALSRGPERPIHHLQLGYIARTMGDRSAAQAAFSRAAELEGGKERAWIELAMEEHHQGRLDQAVSLLKTVLAENPYNAQAMTALAILAQQVDDIEGAVALWRSAIAIDNSNFWSHLLLADGLEQLGKSRAAEEALEICELKFGALPEIQLARTRIFTNRGDYAAARAELAKATALFPAHFEVRFQRVLSLIAGGAFEEARHVAQTPPGRGAQEKARLSMLRGEIAAAEWKLEEAYSHYVDALQFNPADSWVNDCAAKVALLRGDVEAAKSHLGIALRNNPVHRFQHNGGCKMSQTHIGQLLDEFRMDVAVLERLRSCMAAEDSIEALGRLVLEFPDYTPAAMRLLIALRQKGLLASPGRAGKETSPIPARITQFWDEKIPADVEAFCDAWREAHPTYRYSRFSKRQARHFLAEFGPPGALAAFDRAIEPAMKADVFRLAHLYHEGGYYIDADDRCLAPLHGVDPGGRDLILYQEDFGTVANNFIGAIPRHPAIGMALSSAIQAINRGDADLVWLATGPALMTRSLASYLAENPRERLSRTLILERHEIHSAIAIHCMAAYKHTRKHWSRTAFKKSRAQADLDGLLLELKSQIRM
jgi:tetratricopeptide (TPR) repeat protein